MQARIDPQFLFDALAAVERIHDVDAAAGDRLLDNLIKYLRAVLPDLIATRSTVGKEVELAAHGSTFDDEIVGADGIHAIEATGDVGNRPFPAMTMIPLAEAVLSEAPASATLTSSAHCGCADDGPYRLPLPCAASRLRCPLAHVDRVALAGCLQRVALDVGSASNAVIYKSIAVDAAGKMDLSQPAVAGAVDELYKHALLRPPTALKRCTRSRRRLPISRFSTSRCPA
jgi:hypothetical protein